MEKTCKTCQSFKNGTCTLPVVPVPVEPEDSCDAHTPEEKK
jgi:hypothetical protein